MIFIQLRVVAAFVFIATVASLECENLKFWQNLGIRSCLYNHGQTLSGKMIPSPNPCEPNPCKNDGLCFINTNTIDYYCFCNDGDVGATCERVIRVDPCKSAICVHGVCHSFDDGTGSYCACNDGYRGEKCDNAIPVDPCEPAVCGHGVCHPFDDGAGYYCACTDGYTGEKCDKVTPVSPCISADCGHGICHPFDDSTGHYCACSNGYTGDKCDKVTPINPCKSANCGHGTCHSFDDSTGYYCACAIGYTGEKCDKVTPVNPCKSANCGHGVCHSYDDSTGYYCACTKGYVGEKCDQTQVVDHCTSNPCNYEGKCSNNKDNDGYVCECNYPTTGKDCEEMLGGCCDCAYYDEDKVKVIFAFSSDTLSWSAAKKECEDKGYQLYRPTEFNYVFSAQRLLKEKYYRNNNKDAFWVGIYKNTTTGTYSYVDGAPFELSFIDNRQKSSDLVGNCAALARLDGSDEFKLAFFDCDIKETDSWSYYYICEKYYSYLTGG